MLFRMILPAFLVVVWLMGTAGTPVCPSGCRMTNHHHPCVKHVSELRNSSVAPWKLELSTDSEGELEPLEVAKCTTCSVENMVPKPIFIQIWVNRRTRNGSAHHWCRCPYKLSVGCTCVQKQ